MKTHFPHSCAKTTSIDYKTYENVQNRGVLGRDENLVLAITYVKPTHQQLSVTIIESLSDMKKWQERNTEKIGMLPVQNSELRC